MDKLITEIKKYNSDLKESEIEGLLYLLKTNNNYEVKDLINITGLTNIVVVNFLTNIKRIPDFDKILSAHNPRDYKWSLYKDNFDKNELEIIKKLTELRSDYTISAKRNFDQFYADPISSYKKAKILVDKGMYDGKKIALIGDDDFVCIALGLIGGNYYNIDVFEIDEQLVNFLKNQIEQLSLKNINIFKYDARDNLSKNFLNKYDAVLIDPPYTRYGVELFIHRSLELLQEAKDFSGKYIFLNFGSGLKNTVKEIKIQDVINQYSILIEDKINKFTKYSNAQTIGNTSSMYILKVTPQTTINDFCENTKIYTFENDPDEKFPYIDHFVFKIKDIRKEIITSKISMQKILGEFCTLHKLKVIDMKITKFSNQGLSFTFILASSNLVVHTWPEYLSCHMDLITCNPIFNKNKFAQSLSDLFQTNIIDIRKVE